MIRRRLLLYMFILLVPVMAYTSPWDEDSIAHIFSGRTVDDVEGVWRFPRGGAVLLICRASAISYDIRVLDSPRLDMRPGTKIGEIYETPKKNTYDGNMRLKPLGKKVKLKSSDMVFKVTDDGYLCLYPYKTGYSISFKRLFYRFFKIPIVENEGKPDGLIGAKRIFPPVKNPRIPICL